MTPQHPDDLPAIADALGSLMPDERGEASAVRSGRISIPALDGVDTLVEAVSRMRSADITLVEVVLRRPSLDDVFFALTQEPATRPGDTSAADVPL
jgi:ABC-2 type transport system ATP-binding protein